MEGKLFDIVIARAPLQKCFPPIQPWRTASGRQATTTTSTQQRQNTPGLPAFFYHHPLSIAQTEGPFNITLTMFSRALFRSARTLSRIPTTTTQTRHPPRAISRHFPAPISQRFESSFRRYPPPPPPRRPDKIIHRRWDPEHAQNAKPLLTVEGMRRTVTSGPSKILVVLTVGSATVFYFTHLEEVPESGRKRFMCYSEEMVEEQGQLLYQEIIQNEGRAILPEWDARTRMVNRVMDRLIQANGLEHVPWEIHVIQSDREHPYSSIRACTSANLFV
jgi:hypothetical protein